MREQARHRLRAERGTISIVLGMGALLFATLALAIAEFGGLLLARARAQSAADAAALAAVVEQVPALAHGIDPQTAAQRAAESNGAHLESCACRSGNQYATVVVSVASRGTFVPGWRGVRAHAQARAEVDADLLTYRR
jgi:Flp pilus assembly protein TadG